MLIHDCSLNTASAVTVPNEFVTSSVIASSASNCFRADVSRGDKPRTKGKTERGGEAGAGPTVPGERHGVWFLRNDRESCDSN